MFCKKISGIKTLHQNHREFCILQNTSYHRLFWVIEKDSYASLNGKTVVLVRGNSATLPTVSWTETETGSGLYKWSLENGVVQAIARQSLFLYFNGL